MTRLLPALAFAAASGLAAGQAAADILIEDAYARSATPLAKTGAAFMVIRNTGAAPDRLIGATSPAAMRVELHTHVEAGAVMQMRPAEDGFAIPAGGSRALARGGDHVMFMGLTAPWADGDTVPLILDFEEAGEISVELPVDRTRPAGPDG